MRCRRYSRYIGRLGNNGLIANKTFIKCIQIIVIHGTNIQTELLNRKASLIEGT